MKVGDVYLDEVGYKWEVISTDGPPEFPIVCKYVTGPSNIVRIYDKKGRATARAGVNLILAKVRWVVLWDCGLVGVRETPPIGVEMRRVKSLRRVVLEEGVIDQ